jgi:hypothetical protein
MIINTTVPHGEQESPTVGIRATTSGFSHQQIGSYIIGNISTAITFVLLPGKCL